MSCACASLERRGRLGETDTGAPWVWPWEAGPYDERPIRSADYHPGFASTTERDRHPAPKGYRWIHNTDVIPSNKGTFREWTLASDTVARNLAKSKADAAKNATFGAAVDDAFSDVTAWWGERFRNAAGSFLPSIPKPYLIGGAALALLLLLRR